jgi:hypothetical protein
LFRHCIIWQQRIKRGEAIMAHFRDAACGGARLPKHRLAWLAVAPLLILTLPARSGSTLDETPGSATAQPAVAPTTPPPRAAVDVAAVTPAATVAAPTLPQPDDRQRRVLMLLLMNSAGPVRPYGNLGR